MTKNYRHDPVAAVILLTILAALFFYIFSVPTEVREELLPSTVTYENTWLTSSPGGVPIQKAEIDFKLVTFPTTTVDNTLKAEPTLLSNQFSVSSGVYSAVPQAFSFNIDDTAAVYDVRVPLTVAGKSGSGRLEASLNGQKIYSASNVIGEQAVIIIPTHLLQTGANSLTFSASSPGFKFWQSNSYVLSSATIEISRYSSNQASVARPFSLSSDEAANIESSELTMFVRRLSTVSTNLEVGLNGATLFSGIPPSTFSVDVPTNLLKSGQNDITFSVDEEGKYEMNFIVIRIQTETIKGGLDYFFTISSSDWRRVQGGAYTCEMLIRKTTGANSVVVQLNSHTGEYHFSAGEVKVDVCEQLREGSNKISITSDEALDLADISVGIKP